MQRLLKPAEFKRVFDARRIASDERLTVFALPNGRKYCRLGVSIAKKKCPKAVRRNRWKRMVRETFRRYQFHFSCCVDLVVVPNAKNIIDIKTPLGNALESLVRRIALKTMPTVLITRPLEQCEPLKSELQALGFCVFLQPVIEIQPPDDWSETDKALDRLQRSEFDYLVFSSPNGVKHFCDRFACRSANGANNGNTFSGKIVTVGPGTEAALYRRIKRKADIVPETFSAEGIVEAFRRSIGEVRHRRFLLIAPQKNDCGKRPAFRNVLKDGLTALGGLVTEIAVYQSTALTQPESGIDDLMQRGKINYATVTSPAVGTALVNMFGEKLRSTKLVSISPLTSSALNSLGFPPQLEAGEASMTGIVMKLQADCLFQGVHLANDSGKST
ncbi:MAG: ribonuclease P protein component [Planctomycetaceae bacterium]|jgi:ribonuclease P protein component|nr:ribonuclease P protein component [Planctomycetaceae bacterium]